MREAKRGPPHTGAAPAITRAPARPAPAQNRRMHGLRETLRGKKGVYDISIPPFKN